MGLGWNMTTFKKYNRSVYLNKEIDALIASIKNLVNIAPPTDIISISVVRRTGKSTLRDQYFWKLSVLIGRLGYLLGKQKAWNILIGIDPDFENLRKYTRHGTFCRKPLTGHLKSTLKNL